MCWQLQNLQLIRLNCIYNLYKNIGSRQLNPHHSNSKYITIQSKNCLYSENHGNNFFASSYLTYQFIECCMQFFTWQSQTYKVMSLLGRILVVVNVGLLGVMSPYLVRTRLVVEKMFAYQHTPSPSCDTIFHLKKQHMFTNNLQTDVHIIPSSSQTVNRMK